MKQQQGNNSLLDLLTHISPGKKWLFCLSFCPAMHSPQQECSLANYSSIKTQKFRPRWREQSLNQLNPIYPDHIEENDSYRICTRYHKAAKNTPGKEAVLEASTSIHLWDDGGWGSGNGTVGCNLQWTCLADKQCRQGRIQVSDAEEAYCTCEAQAGI